MKNGQLYKNIHGRWGRITMRLYEDSHQRKHLVAQPKGYVSFSMIREDYSVIRDHPNSHIIYYVDLTNFVLPNPINLYYLRQLHRLENVASYYLIVDQLVLKKLFGLLKPVIKFSEILRPEDFAKRVV